MDISCKFLILHFYTMYTYLVFGLFSEPEDSSSSSSVQFQSLLQHWCVDLYLLLIVPLKYQFWWRQIAENLESRGPIKMPTDEGDRNCHHICFATTVILVNCKLKTNLEIQTRIQNTITGQVISNSFIICILKPEKRQHDKF